MTGPISRTGDKIVLVVEEDDLRFGKIIIEKAHQYDLKAIVATNYIEVFDFVNRFTPIAITLDVKLPDTSGWKVLDLLRNDLNYRHIPIHLISGEESEVTGAQTRLYTEASYSNRWRTRRWATFFEDILFLLS